jgi:hypothetical protein
VGLGTSMGNYIYKGRLATRGNFYFLQSKQNSKIQAEKIQPPLTPSPNS